MRFISRSSHEDFTRCPRRGYYRYLYNGSGFDSRTPSIHLLIGLGVHKGLEILLKTNGDIEAAISAQKEEWASLAKDHQIPEETEHLIEALVRGWYRACWPTFIEQFEILMVEEEVKALLAPNITLNARADAVIRDRETGAIYVLNWKTSGSISDWNKQWEDEVQAWTEALVTEAVLGAPISGVIFEGLYKGTYREGRNHSPLIYGWKLPLGGGREIFSARYKRYTKEEPWIKFPVWASSLPVEGGIRGWVDWLPLDVLREQFVRSTPILKNDRVVENWVRQVVRRETDIDRMLQEDVPEADREDFFTQHFSKINCGGCPFRKVCKLQTTIEEMIANGDLVRRVDHHAGNGADMPVHSES